MSNRMLTLVLAAAGLASSYVAGTYELFVVLLRDTDAGIRENGALGLAELGDDRSERPLTDALQDADAGVRATAVLGLGRLEHASSLGPLTAALDDPAVAV